jgi:DeoR family ulaG and ulaABCDEF operon transcriptional repressor
MLERERHGLILKLVNERSIVSVGELAGLLDASEATIRGTSMRWPIRAS